MYLCEENKSGPLLPYRFLCRLGEERQEGRMTSYCKVDICFLFTFETNYITVKASLDTKTFKQADSQNMVEYVQALSTKALHSRPVFNAHYLERRLEMD